MNFFGAIQSGFSNYVNFKGRAIRSEYNYWVLFAIIIGAISGILDSMAGYEDWGDPSPINSIASLILLLPNLSVMVRRFHDINMSGWWYVALQIAPSILAQFMFIFSFISFIALFAYLYFMCAEGGGDNQYGPNPLGNKDQS